MLESIGTLSIIAIVLFFLFNRIEQKEKQKKEDDKIISALRKNL
jgi:preprotein translocase subunit YajC